MENRTKFFIFSDESGSWHDPADIYVRSWVVITSEEYNKLLAKVDEIASFIGSKELSWNTLAGNKNLFHSFDGISFRIFITVSCPKDISWGTKYRLTKNFETSILGFDFGELDEGLRAYIKDRIYKDIKNALFLNFYERYHIENAKKGIERVIKPTDYDLIYRIDPPQMPQEGWKNILQKVDNSSSINIEFPKSSRTQGIQFADVVAGCFRSLLLKGRKFEESKEFLKVIKDRIIQKNKENPNPNLIFFGEMNNDIKLNCADIWKY